MMHLSRLVSLPDELASLEFLAQQLSWGETETKVAHDLWEKGLPPLADTETLPYIFGVRPKFMSAMGRFPQTYYRRFRVAKHRGGMREIWAPRRALKVVQRWINHHMLSSVELPSYVMGFVKGRNIVANARLHTEGTNLMVVDIEDFFPSVNAEMIKRVFEELGFPSLVARQLTSLCSLEGKLPQGAPTSPAIANAVFRGADTELKKLADSWQCHYSRYADDLAFSGPKRFTVAEIHEVESIVNTHGFAVNRSKSRRTGAGGRQLVTGLVVNYRAQPPRRRRRLWRAMFHRAARHPHEFSDRRKRLQGIAAFVNQYDPDLASEYREVADAVAKQSNATSE